MMKSLRRAKRRTQASHVRRAGAREPPTGTTNWMIVLILKPKTQVTSRPRRNQARRRVKKRRQAAEDRELAVEDAEDKEELRPLLVTRLPLEASAVALQRTQSQM